MNPKPCPACTSPIDLEGQQGLKPDLTLACPHCGVLLRTLASDGDGWPFRLMTLVEAGQAHHEVLARLLIGRAAMRGERGWTTNALSLLLTLHGHLVKLAAGKEEGQMDLLEVAHELVDDELINAVERVLLGSEMQLTGLEAPNADEDNDQ